MMGKKSVLLSALAVLMLVSAAGSSSRANASPAKAVDCDRTCLNGFVDQYMAAVAAHDPSKLPHTANVRYSENNVEMPLGEGLWQSSDGWGSYKVYVDDPQAGEVGFLAVSNEDGNLSCFAGRLKVTGQKVSEIEIVVARPERPSPPSANGIPVGGPQNLHDKPLFNEDVPGDQRVSRQELIRLANGYFDTIQLHTGRAHHNLYPHLHSLENAAP